MLKLDNKPLSYDRAFTHAGIQYPANWLRLASLEEKTALGITEVANDPTYDQRFYWGVDNPKQLNDVTDEDGNTTTGLKTQWKATQSDICDSLLSPSDWRVTRAAELGQAVASAWLTYRGAVRSACNTRQTEINAVADVPALIELLFGQPTITRQQTDAEGVGVVEPDTITNEAGETVANPVAGDPVMETVANPAIATAWPTPI
ncbi:hypothetical protein OAE68_01350 [Synechococcus sp. AH-551-A10]|nr:hypothetical protein [Synechococcus sp. AH-551-A10]MDB4682305.1 hypothetical protein [Synechococcus sp. AH-551-A10]